MFRPVIVVLLGVVPAGTFACVIWLRYGREPPLPPAPERITGPPTNEAPALAAAIIDPISYLTKTRGFAGTLCDLLRRGYLELAPRAARPFGVALAPTTKPISDLSQFERTAYDAIKSLAHPKPLTLDRLPEAAARSPAFMDRFEAFCWELESALEERGWWSDAGRNAVRKAGQAAWVIMTGALIVGAATRSEPLLVVGLAAAGNVAVLWGFRQFRRGTEKRTAAGARAASQWMAFQRFLSDLPSGVSKFQGSLDSWERLLCYAVALPIPDEVLSTLQSNASPQVLVASPLSRRPSRYPDAPSPAGIFLRTANAVGEIWRARWAGAQGPGTAS